MAKKTRVPWLALAVSVALSMSSLADSPQVPNFSPRWAATDLQKLKGKTGTFEARTFTRYVFSSEGAYSVGSVSYFKAPKRRAPLPNGAKDPYDPQEVAAQIGKAMGFSSWHERNQKNAKVYEQYWEKLHRIVRLYVAQDDDTFTTSVAVWRVEYGDTVAIESELLQRQLTGTLDMSIPWLEKATSALIDLGEASAYADPCPPCGSDPLSQLACASCSANQLTPVLGQLNNNIGQLNNNLGNANTNWGNSNTNWGNSNTNWANSNTNWANSNAQLAQANQNWANTNNELHRANDLVAQAMQPGTAFVLGAATGAGVAFGGLLVSLVAEGVGKLIGGLVELITGNMANQERLQKFEEKRQAYEKLKPEIQKMEDMIDGSIKIMRMAAHANTHCTAGMTPTSNPSECPKDCNPPLSGTSAIKGLECLIAMTSNSLRAEKNNARLITEIQDKAASNPGLDAACRDQLNAEGARLDVLIRQNEDLMNTLMKFNHQQVCDGAKDAIRGVITAEQQISSARARLTSERSRQSWRDAQYGQEQEDRELSDHKLSDAEKQRSADQGKALDAWHDQIDRLDRDFRDSQYKDQYKKYQEWREDQVRHCATHSESWTEKTVNSQNETIVSHVDSGGGFQCGIPIIGLPACPNAWRKCANHHGFDTPPENMQGEWWDTYYRRRKRSDEAYWISFRQSQSNFNAERASALASKPDPVKQARARQEHDKWLNAMLDDENVVEQTRRMNELDGKEEDITNLCADQW